MANHNLGGVVNNTSGYSGPWGANAGNFVYTDGYGMPTARVDLAGNTPIYLGTIYAAYTSGPLNGKQMVYQSVLTAGGTLFPTSGGTAQLRFLFTGGGTLYFGRNTANGLVSIPNRSGGPGFTGGLVGSVDWGQVASVPLSLTAVPGPSAGTVRVDFAAPASNGDLTITSYTIQYASSLGGPWTTLGTTTTGVNNVVTPPAGPFYYRVYATNTAGNSVAAATASPVVSTGGGERFNGSAFVGLVTAKRYTGSAWVNLVTRKRYNGASWVSIS